MEILAALHVPSRELIISHFSRFWLIYTGLKKVDERCYHPERKYTDRSFIKINTKRYLYFRPEWCIGDPSSGARQGLFWP